MKVRRVLSAALVAALFLSASLGLASPPLTEEQISEAQMKANRLVPQEKIIFAYRSMESAGISCRL